VICLLVGLFGEAFLLVFEVDNNALFLLEHNESLLEVPFTHLQDLLQLVLGLNYSENLFFGRILFRIFFFFAFLFGLASTRSFLP